MELWRLSFGRQEGLNGGGAQFWDECGGIGRYVLLLTPFVTLSALVTIGRPKFGLSCLQAWSSGAWAEAGGQVYRRSLPRLE